MVLRFSSWFPAKKFARKISNNYKSNCWALKCDIKKFFASVDHEILLQLLERKIQNKDIIWLLKQIIDSFYTQSGEGIPLGDLTSQVFANIYLNELDQFIKHKLKVKYYLRYADDFVFIVNDKESLTQYVDKLKQFLSDELKLDIHPKKIKSRRLDNGIDFLGYIVLPHYILPRTKTRRRMFKKLSEKVGSENFNQSLQSYLGYLKHAKSYRLTQKLQNEIWFWLENEKGLLPKWIYVCNAQKPVIEASKRTFHGVGGNNTVCHVYF